MIYVIMYVYFIKIGTYRRKLVSLLQIMTIDIVYFTFRALDYCGTCHADIFDPKKILKCHCRNGKEVIKIFILNIIYLTFSYLRYSIQYEIYFNTSTFTIMLTAIPCYLKLTFFLL